MTTFHALFLGLLQGLTEFLPISSSGHLVLAEAFLGLDIDPKSMQGFDVLLHAGTLLALLCCYAQTWWRIIASLWSRQYPTERGMLILLIIATVPAAIIGVLFEDVITFQLRSPQLVAFFLFLTGVVLLLGEWRPASKKNGGMRFHQSFLIGLAQACALIPGASRSGLTISAGRWVGLSRREALDFSFLMLAPVAAGASILTLIDVVTGEVLLPALSMTLWGFFASFVSSALAILFLRRWVVSHSLAWFVLYLFPVSLILIMM